MEYRDLIEKNFDSEVEALQRIVALKSVGEPEVTAEGEVYPFGEGVQKCFEETLKLGEELGFKTYNADNYGGHIEFGEGDEVLGILGHLDVVPEGTGWSFDPYSAAVSDGYIYGRGTQDDKGPVIAALYAMKALKDAGFEPERKVRLILGLDEETAWKGMYYYLDKAGAPDLGFTPDADFPGLNGEKGIMSFTLVKKFAEKKLKGLSLRSLSGGSASNMVAEGARAVVMADDEKVYDEIKALAEAYRGETDRTLTVRRMGKSLEITAKGISAHGATPDAGLNAISIMMDFLGRLNFADEDINDYVAFYNDYIGFDVHGERFGCPFEDDKSGKLTLNVGVADFDRKSMSLTINVRYPVTCTAEQVYEGFNHLVEKYDMGIVKEKEQAPIYMEPDSPMITTLREIYAENSGDYESRPRVIGGGTYARCAENIIAFGALFPGDEDRMHQKDERLSLDRLKDATKIYADVIARLGKKDFPVPGRE